MAELVRDGTTDFSLGQDAWHVPGKIQPNQYAAGVNVSARGGVLKPRPPFDQQDMDFEEKYIVNDFGYTRTIENIWATGKYQALIPFYMYDEYYLITVISGIIYKTRLSNMYTSVLSDTIYVNQYQARVNWTYAGDNIVLFDYPNRPVIITPTDVRRADPDHTVNGQTQPEVPVATLGAYNQNRLFIANAGTEITAGDPAGSLLTPEAPLTFTEIFEPSSPYVNQVFSLPTDETNTPIVAMGFMQLLDQNPGIGPLFVSTEKNLFFYKTNQPRVNWTQGEFSGLLLANAGMAGARSFINVNSDLIFLSAENNIHALSTARNEMNKWGNVPISREVSNYLKCYDKSLLKYAVLAYHNNRILISTNPYRMACQDRNLQLVSDYAHAGLVVLEVDTMSSMLIDSSPTWAGLWTGIDVMDMVTVNGRLYLIAKDGGRNKLFVLDEDKLTDCIDGQNRRVRSIVYTKAYEFERPFDQKQEGTAVLYLQELAGKVDVKLERKVAHSTEWLLWDTWEHIAPDETPYVPDDSFVNGFAKHEIRHVVFGDPVEDGCSPINGDMYNTFREIQLRLTVEANDWMLESIKLEANLVPFLERRDYETYETVAIPEQVSPDWTVPEVTLCVQS